MCVPLRTTLPRVPIRMLGVILDQSLRVKAGSSAGGRRDVPLSLVSLLEPCPKVKFLTSGVQAGMFVALSRV